MNAEYVEQREENYFVRGSRVSLDSLVYGFLDGESPETIRDNFPTLTLAQVYGAIAFYLSHQVEIDAYLKAKQSSFEAARQSQTHISSELRARVTHPAENLEIARETTLPRGRRPKARDRQRLTETGTVGGLPERARGAIGRAR